MATLDSMEFQLLNGWEDQFRTPFSPISFPILPLSLPAIFRPQVRETGGEDTARQCGDPFKLLLLSSHSRPGDHGPNSTPTAPARESGVWSL